MKNMNIPPFRRARELRLVVIVIFVIMLCCFVTSKLINTGFNFKNGIESQTYKTWPDAESQNVVKHCLTGEVIGRVRKDLPVRPFSVANQSKAADETDNDRRAAFEDIFTRRGWGGTQDKNNLQASGAGSTLDYAQEIMGTLHVIVNLVKELLNVKVVRLLDAPCGDLRWMRRFLVTRDDINYTGMDIVPSVIEHHRQTYAETNWKFRLGDFVKEPLAESYDIILCRKALQHLYNADVMKALAHFSESNSKFLLATTFSYTKENPANLTSTGRFNSVNLEIAPFSLAPPLCTGRDGPPRERDFVSLWKLPLQQISAECRKPEEFTIQKFSSKPMYSCTAWSP